jgi:membrane-bound inhibitor of C-type lysozyme
MALFRPHGLSRSWWWPLALLLPACSLPYGEPPVSVDGAEVARVYECRDDYAFLVRLEGDVARLFLPDRTLSLPRQQMASGTKYGRGDVALSLWKDEAMLEIDHETRRTCILNPKRKTLD